MGPDQTKILVQEALKIRIVRADFDDSSVSAPLEMTMWLDTDIYVAVNWPDRDNRKIAALNAPLFNKFLRHLLANLPIRLESVDSDYFNYIPELLNNDGFVEL